MAYQRAQKAAGTGQNKLFILLLAFALFSSAAKDLERVQSFASNVRGFVSSHMGIPVYASEVPSLPEICPQAMAQEQKHEEFHWAGQIASGQSIEIKGINGGITAEPARSGQVEVFATKKARRSDPSSVDIKVVPHAAGVTICATYPGESGQRTSCDPSALNMPSSNVNVVNNDVSVEFMVKVPQGVSFIGRTVNGEISALSLDGNVDSRTVNGSIDVSTTGYARAKTVNGQITAKMGRADWTDALEFKTVNGGIALDLPASLSTKIEAETFNGEISSDFPLTVLGRISRKRMSGTIGEGGRQLLLKTLNGSIHLRRAG